MHHATSQPPATTTHPHTPLLPTCLPAACQGGGSCFLRSQTEKNRGGFWRDSARANSPCESYPFFEAESMRIYVSLFENSLPVSAELQGPVVGGARFFHAFLPVLKIPCACASARASVFLAPVRHLSPARNQCIFTWESGAPENGALVYALASFCRNPSCRLRAVGGGFKSLAKHAPQWGASAKST